MNNTQFVLSILCVILIARLAPFVGNTGGILKPEITVKYFAVSIIFLNSGLTLPTEDLAGAILQWDVHLFIQSFTFIAFPAIIGVLSMILRYTFLHPSLLDGITILSTMPPPVSSAIILTKAVGGNEGAAVFNSVLGSMMGIVVTPFLILVLLGTKEGDVPTGKIFQQLFLTVVVPLLIGQMIRNYNYRWMQRQRIPFATIGQFLILFIIYTTFCDTFSRTDFQMGLSELAVTIILMLTLLLAIQCLLLMCSYYLFNYEAEDAICIMFVGSHKNLALVFFIQAAFMMFLLYSSYHFNFTSKDSVTIMYCGTHKSLTLGIPVIEIIFEGSADLSFLSIPLLIYNPMQIVFGAFSIGFMQAWLDNQKRKRRSSRRSSRSSSRN